MEYATKEQLRKSMRGFLAQRKHIYRELKLRHLEEICILLQKRFCFIRDWSYWRHCLEVRNAEHLIMFILPSATGGHATTHKHMLELIAHCKQVSSLTKLQYDNQAQKIPSRP
ncbi:hypothetical protein [Marinoscillum furvescens]|uniref:Uncharacterized protein n=1 Tax=Marinoscillum furvescens DSM 4134 TaxID=1122208 RepID=A0A3D9L5A1_MARFU|nr:hypothetical protein [Marinoscillum furvescens]REE01089.1 hypothetical protein C7460_104109 [Marinoscillum furvescens DSM 4134]